MPTGKAGLCPLKPDYKQNQKKEEREEKGLHVTFTVSVAICVYKGEVELEVV